VIAMTEPLPPRVEPQGEPLPCRTCGGRIINTILGWIHLEEHDITATGWLCPQPHMHLAEPDFLAETPEDDHAPPATPKRVPTPVPPRRELGQAESSPKPAAPAHWPPLRDEQWWEPQ